MSPINQSPIVLNEVMQLGDDERLQCPAELRRVVTWMEKRARRTLIAELVDPGYVRLRPEEHVLPSIEAVRTLLAEESDAITKLGVLADRYRKVVQQLDFRVRLTEPVLLFLEIQPGEQPFLLLQASAMVLEVMSLRYRNSLLSKFKAETTIELT